jgi:iron complex outermembrane receptor protein
MTLGHARLWRITGHCLFCAALLCAGAARADNGDSDSNVALPKLAADLTKVPFDELLEVEVTSVSKRAEPVGAAAAAVFVLTGSEIRRSGVQSIAEALRLVPGLEVAQRTGVSYAISARGFNNTSADKLEVLLDGRSVYTPLTSSVFWDVLDTYLPDIDRIEVIRGPGAALWGANAVNGVINIITKSAAQTQGVSAQVHGGTEERYGASARMGLGVGDAGSVRLYAQGYSRDNTLHSDGSVATDSMRMMQTGFRSDWTLSGGHTLMVSGNAYEGAEAGTTINSDGTPGPAANTTATGGDLLARWTCCATEDGRWSVQGSYDGYRRKIPTVFNEQRKTADLEAQQQWLLGSRNTLVYGAGVKSSHDDTGQAPDNIIVFDPAKRTLATVSAFAQDQISLFDNAATLTVGSKFEHNSFTGFEVQPSIRVGWQVSPAVFTWSAVSRAVRTPNRIDQDLAIFCPLPNGFPGACGPGLSRIGNPAMASEKLVAFEWGLRVRSHPHLLWDLATYYNHYTSVRSTEPTTVFGLFENNLRAEGYGAEVSIIWQPFDTLEIRPWYSFLALNAHPEADSADTTTAAALEGSNPRHQAGLVIAWEPAPRWQMQSFLRYVGDLKQSSTPSATSGSTRVAAYTELNLRLAHSFGHGLELGIVGSNLLHDHHAESGAESSRSELQRAGLIELRWNWQ